MAVSIVNFFLWSVYVEYFSVLDYGTINLLLSMEVIAKIIFRFGLDGAFLRFLYECKDTRGQQQLASTIFFFLLLIDGATLLVLLAASPGLASVVLGDRANVNALRLMLLNTFAIGFTFIPFSMLQMEQRAAVFSLMTLYRSVATIVLRLVLVVGAGMGIGGLYLADLIVTTTTFVFLARWFVPLIKPVFSRATLRETLHFGLPRLPHAAAQQVMAVGDKFVLKLFVSLDNIGVYGVSVSFGLMQKLFLNAFQSAWAPFIFDTAREKDAQPIFRTVTTYGIAILALLTAGLSTIGRDTVAAMTHGRLLAANDPRWAEVQTVITWTAVGVFLQGFYLLTSIGLNITKRTAYYPIATIPAAAVNIGLNFLLIPHFGIVGAAWANGAGYTVQALLGFVFSQRFYRIEYEWSRLLRISGAALAATVAARALPSMNAARFSSHVSVAALADVAVRGTAVTLVYIGLLAATGVLHRNDLARLRSLRPRRRKDVLVTTAPDATEAGGAIGNADLALMPDTVKVQAPLRDAPPTTPPPAIR